MTGVIEALGLYILDAASPTSPGLGGAKVNAIAEWHFPVSADGLVHPGSEEAKAKVGEFHNPREDRLLVRGAA